MPDDLPPELILRAFEATIDDVLPGERSVVARINTAAVDRFKTVIDPMGARLENYRKNPVVLWEHGEDPVRGRVPIGRNLWVKARKAEKDLVAKTVFADDEFSRGIFDLYQSGTLRSFSINGGPLSGTFHSAPTAAEVRSRPELADCKLIVRGWDLHEYSAVAVPGNQEALALAVSRGLWVPEAVRSTLAARSEADLPPFPQRPELPPLVGRRLSAAIEARRAAVRREGEDLRARLDLRRGIV